MVSWAKCHRDKKNMSKFEKIQMVIGFSNRFQLHVFCREILPMSSALVSTLRIWHNGYAYTKTKKYNIPPRKYKLFYHQYLNVQGPDQTT